MKVEWPIGISNNEDLSQINPAEILNRSVNSIEIQNYILNTIRVLLVPVFILKYCELLICNN